MVYTLNGTCYDSNESCFIAAVCGLQTPTNSGRGGVYFDFAATILVSHKMLYDQNYCECLSLRYFFQ